MILLLLGLILLILWLCLAVIRYLAVAATVSPPTKRAREEEGLCLACLGDSITYGVISASYVNLLRKRSSLKKWAIHNGGMNSWRVSDITSRLDTLLACRPDVVTCCAGTNDIYQEYRFFQTLEGEELKKQVKRREERFRRDVEDLIRGIRDRLGDIPLAFLTVPPLGESFSHPIMGLIRDYNAILQEVCREKKVTLLPFFSVLQDLCLEHPRIDTPSFKGIRRTVVCSNMKRFFFFFSYQQLSEYNQLSLHTDFVHLNEKGAALAADLIEGYLTSLHPS